MTEGGSIFSITMYFISCLCLLLGPDLKDITRRSEKEEVKFHAKTQKKLLPISTS